MLKMKHEAVTRCCDRNLKELNCMLIGASDNIMSFIEVILL
jgi:hypothetical protein